MNSLLQQIGFFSAAFGLRLMCWAVLSTAGALAVGTAARMVSSPAKRSALWTFYFLGLLAAPAIDFALPNAFQVFLNVPSQRMQPSEYEFSSLPGKRQSREPGIVEGIRSSVPRGSGALTTPVTVTFRMLWVYLIFLGTFAVITRLVLGWFKMSGIRHRSRVLPEDAAPSISRDFAARFGFRRRIEIRVTDMLQVPAAFGLIHPTLLIPEDELDAFLSGQLKGAAAHEVAHIVRNDFGRTILSYFVCAIFWFSPGAWLARSCLKRDIELACDDMAIWVLGDGREYARTLGRMALLSIGCSPVPACSLLLFRSKRTLVMRMREALVSRDRKIENGHGFRVTVGLGVLLAMAAFGLTGIATEETSEGPGIRFTSAKDRVVSGLNREHLEFPVDHAVGMLYVACPTCSSGRDQTVGAAIGDVPLVPNTEYVLQLNPRAAESYSFLENLVSSPIREVDFNGIDVSPSDLDAVAGLRRLKILDLTGCAIGDEALGRLSRMKNLRILLLNNTYVTPGGVAALKRRMPECAVIMNSYSASILRQYSNPDAFSWPEKWTAFGPVPSGMTLADSILSMLPRSLRVADKDIPAVLVEADGSEWVDLEPVFGVGKEGKTAWLFREIQVPADITVTVWCAADWWMSWYVDGVPVFDTQGSGNLSTNYRHPNHSFKLRLSKGRHIVAVRVESGSRGWGVTSVGVVEGESNS